MILLNPGPVNLSERVRRALLGPDLCHREPEFSALQRHIRERLLAVYGLADEGWAAVLLTGSGTAAVEAMIASLAPAEGRLLVVENGVYGERMSRMAELHGLPRSRLHHEWGAPVDTGALERALEAEPEIACVAVVHHETTTGRLNELARIGAICRAHGAGLLVDAVSSFGAEALDFERWGIDACAATASKCLHGAPGAAFVVVRRDALAAAPRPPRSVYLDLASYCREQDRGGTPFTQTVQTLYALGEALDELSEEGGWRVRHERYGALAGTVRSGLGTLGLEPLLDEAACSVVLSAWHLPPGLDYRALHDGLKRRGFVIYAGQGPLAERVFRVSTMGAIGEADIRRFLEAVREVRDAHATRPAR